MQYSISRFLLLCIFFWSCDQPTAKLPKSESNSAAMAAVTTITKAPEESYDRVRKEQGEKKYNYLKKQISDIIDTQKEWDTKDWGYKRTAQWGENSGTVYFYNGKLAKVKLYYPDMVLGMNGQCYCNYDQNANLQMVTTTSHGNNWAISNYFYKSEDEFVGFSIQEDFSSSNSDEQTTEHEIATIDALHFSVKQDKLDLYEKCKSIAPVLVELALNDDNIYNGTNYFKGQIDSQYTIHARLNINNDFISGEYHYDHSSASLSLYGNLKGNYFKLTERNSKTNEITGSFEGNITPDNTLAGTWKSADNSQQFPFYFERTKEFYTVAGDKLLATQFAKSIAKEDYISTNYFDLPAPQQKEASTYLHTGNTKLLDAYGMEYVLEKTGNTFINNDRYQRMGLDVLEDKFLNQKYFTTIYQNLPEFVAPQERHLGYYHKSEESDFYAQLLSYFVYRLDRSPENIQRIWNILGSTILNRIDKSLYAELHIEAWLDLHLAAYDNLQNQTNYQSQLAQAYAAVDSLNQLKPNLYLAGNNESITIYHQDQFLAPLMETDSFESEHKLTAYSFWMRRHHEGNVDTVARILKEVQAHFERKFE